MEKKRKEHRDRLLTLALVSVLLILIYGPGAPWFIAADRFVYDQVASRLNNESLADGLIVSIEPDKKSPAELLDEYGRLVRIFKEQGARRIIMPQPPVVGPNGTLPGWAAALGDVVPVFVTTGNRFADVATKSGFLDLDADNDTVLRRSRLWNLSSGTMSPSLPLAIALADSARVSDPRMSSIDDSIYLSNYQPIPRLAAADILGGRVTAEQLSNKTIFLDASLPLVAATAILPSGQYVTASEITASLLANLELQETIVAPTWVRALEWLIPALLAIIAALFMPGKKRNDIIFLTVAMIASLVLVEALTLMIFRVRIDLGRPLLIFLGAGILTWWLQGENKQAAVNAYKRGSDFLAAGRLEPAFAELRRCKPTETVATVMYKLSLAFEQQSKPDRAEAVLNWIEGLRKAGLPE